MKNQNLKIYRLLQHRIKRPSYIILYINNLINLLFYVYLLSCVQMALIIYSQITCRVNLN